MIDALSGIQEVSPMRFRWRKVAALFVMMVGGLAVAIPPDPTPQATKLMGAKKFDEAAKQFETYLATNRFDGPAWAQYSVSLHMAKRYPQAIEAAKQAIERGANPSAQMYNIGCGHALMGKT